jgi:hypothetical protein
LEVAPHGSWFLEGQKLIVNFDHKAREEFVHRHVYVEMNPGSDIWHLAGNFHANNAVDAAILEPLQPNCTWLHP